LHRSGCVLRALSPAPAAAAMTRSLSACAQSGDVAGAEEILTRMQASNATIQLASLNFMLKACAKSADGHAAELWFSRMGQWGLAPNRASYCGVILAWVKGGNLERSEHWIRKLYASGFTTPKGFCRQLVRKSMSAASTDVIAQHAEQVTSWLGRLHRMGVPIDRPTVNLLMGAFARSGNIVRTEQWAAFMNEANISPNRSTFCALVTAAQRAHDHQRASKWLACMEELGFAPGDLETDNELGQLIEADSDSGDLADTPTHDSTPTHNSKPRPRAAATTLAAPAQKRPPAQRRGARCQQQPGGTAVQRTPAAGPPAPPGLPCPTPLIAPTPDAVVQFSSPCRPRPERGLSPKKVSVPAFREPWSSPIQSLVAGGVRPLGLGAAHGKAYDAMCYSRQADPVHVWPMRL